MYSSRREASFVRQSTNFCTRLARSELVAAFSSAQAGLFGVLAALLVDQHLLADLLRLVRLFQKIHLQLVPEEVGHGLLDELVGDGLFRLVLVAGPGGKVEDTSTRQSCTS